MLLRCFRGRSLAASLLLLAVSSIAHAQDDPRKLESKKYFDEGVALDASQRRSEALEKFKKAYAVYPSPNVLYNIAREEHLLGKLPDALRDYREAAKNPLLKTQNRDVSQTYIRELEQELGQVKLSGPEGTTFTLDGAAVTLTAEAVPATAGSHRVEATLKGRTESRDVQFAKGQVTSAEFFAANATALTTQPPPTPLLPPPTEPAAGFWTKGRVVGTVVGLSGVVMLGVATAFVVAANSDADAVDQHRAQSSFPDRACNGSHPATLGCSERAEAEDGRVRNSNLGLGLGLGGGALLISGAVLFLTSSPKSSGSGERQARILPSAAPYGVHLHVVF